MLKTQSEFSPVFFREKTRIQIAEEKQQVSAVKLPVSLACVHLQSDGNLGYLIRSAACFGAMEVLVIGQIPSPRNLRQLSCGTNLFMEIKAFRNTSEFLQYIRENDYHLVSLELVPQAKDLTKYRFNQERKTCLITGNESMGVPGDILHHSDCVVIPLPGVGPCLNTSQAANIALYEYVRQRFENPCQS